MKLQLEELLSLGFEMWALAKVPPFWLFLFNTLKQENFDFPLLGLKLKKHDSHGISYSNPLILL